MSDKEKGKDENANDDEVGYGKLAAPSSESDGTNRTVNGSECPFFAIE